MRKAKYITKMKKIKPMTKTPGWLLTMRGFLESYRGENVCDRFIERLYEKMFNQVKDEDVLAEKDLVNLRQEAQELAVDYKKCRQLLEVDLSVDEDASADAVREQRRLTKKVLEAMEEIARLRKQLVELDELIPYINTLRDDRIEKIQMLGTEKILAYVLGINKGRLKDYTNKPFEKKFENASRKLYGGRNAALEKYIHEIVTSEEA